MIGGLPGGEIIIVISVCVGLTAGWLISLVSGLLAGDGVHGHGAIVFISAVVFTGLYLRFGFTAGYLVYSIFSACLITAGIVDLRIRILPNIINAAGIAAAFIISVITGIITSGFGPIRDCLLGAAVCGAPFFFIALIKKDGMGMGDVKFAALIGAFLGLFGGLCALWLGIVLGGIASAALIIAKKATRKSSIPFGPFMAIGALTMIFFGDAIKSFLSAAYHV